MTSLDLTTAYHLLLFVASVPAAIFLGVLYLKVRAMRRSKNW